MRCLKQLTKEEEDQFPLAKRVLESNFYMNDLLTGINDLAEAITLQKQLTDLLARGRFHMRKWRSNKERILRHLAEEWIRQSVDTRQEYAFENLGHFMES